MSKTTTAAPSSSSESWAGTAGEWAARVHHAELPSGMRIVFRFPSLGEMVTFGELPEDLLELAVREWADPGTMVKLAAAPLEQLPDEPTPEQREQAETASRAIAEQIAQLNRHMCAAALIEPHVTAEELAHVPFTDLELLARILNRLEQFDAAGRRIGPESIHTFRAFAEEHRCPEGCQACETSRRRMASIQ